VKQGVVLAREASARATPARAASAGKVRGGQLAAAAAAESAASSTATSADGPAVWSARGVRFRHHGAARHALDGVDLDIPDREMTALLGPNGAGKSTLLQLLMGTLTPDAGEVRFSGRPVGEWPRRALAREVAVVPQNEAEPLFAVRDVVAMGRYPHLGPWRRERVEDAEAIELAMQRCDVARLADRWLPRLSGGERQRVRLARALAQDPSVLVLDEPTAHLDVRHEMTIFALLRELSDQGTTVLLATHNINLAARYADRVVLLRAGRITASGAPAEVITASHMEEVYEWAVSIVPHTSGAPQIVPRDPAGR